MNLSLFFQTSFLFLIILDPIGNIPIVVGVLKGFNHKQQMRIIIRELFLSLVLMLFGFFFGRAFFTLLAIEQSSLQIVGSIAFFLIGVKMLFSSAKAEEKIKKIQDPFMVPIATPAIAGPGILATIMLYASNDEISKTLVLLSIFCAWLCLVPFLLAAPYLKKILKENGVIAVERLFAYIIILIAVEMAIAALKSTITSL